MKQAETETFTLFFPLLLMSFAIVDCSSVIPLSLNFSSSSNNSSEVTTNDLMRSDINRLKFYFLTIWNIDNVIH